MSYMCSFFIFFDAGPPAAKFTPTARAAAAVSRKFWTQYNPTRVS